MAINMDQLADRYKDASVKVGKVTEKELAKLAQVGVGIMKQSIKDYKAIDTGNMRNSVTSRKEGSESYSIGPTVGYSIYVALGTSRMVARPFHLDSARKLASKVDDLGFGPDEIGI